MNQLGSSCAGSIYDNCAAPLPRTLPKERQIVDTGRKPHQTRRQETYEHVDEENRPWYRRPDPEHRDSGKQRGASQVTEEDDIQIWNAHESPQASVKSNPVEDGQFHQNCYQYGLSENRSQAGRNRKVEAEQKSGRHGQPNSGQVAGSLEPDISMTIVFHKSLCEGPEASIALNAAAAGAPGATNLTFLARSKISRTHCAT